MGHGSGGLLRETTAGWWITLSGALVVAVASGIIASGGRVPAWERDVFEAVNGLPDRLEGLMWVFQLAGLLLVPLGVAAVAAAFRRWRLALALAALVPLKLIVEKLVVKQLVERERPAVSICDGDTSCLELRDAPVEGLSFVSGHAIIAWSVATVLWSTLPARWRSVPVVIAALNAVARVYLGAHNPLDVIGGGAVGVALGALVVIVAGLGRRTPDGTRATAGRGNERTDPTAHQEVGRS
ncbi:MAG: phosphatase PAP2 family protein [Actinomycetota bacterium]|nr:phosphatase PAP2 family protein [Actinomycetota bacterium]